MNLESSKKAQSQLMAHVFMLLFSVMILALVLTTLNNIKQQYQEFVADLEIDEVCDTIKEGVGKIYWPTDYSGPKTVKMGEIEILLPVRVGDVKYKAIFAGSTLNIATVDKPYVNDSCKMGFDAIFNGQTSGGLAKLTWTAYSNGTDEINMTII